MKLIKENHKWKTYQLNDYKICYRNKDSISWDNDIAPQETIYLLSGSAEITIKENIEIFTSPSTIIIPEQTYHKIKAITDICFLLYTQ